MNPWIRNSFVLFIVLNLCFVALNAQIFSSAQSLGTSNNPQVIKSADFNNDGYIDIVYASLGDPKIAVALYDEGENDFGNEIVLSPSFNYAVSLFPADLDGDGLVDILTVSQSNHRVAWFKNIDGQSFVLQDYIDIDAQGAASVIAVDMDGDIDLDVVVACKNSNTIQWYENTDGNASFSTPNLISDLAELPVIVIAADIDNDNDQDLVVGMLLTSKIMIFENQSNGNFMAGSILTTDVLSLSSIYTADLDNDGFIDVISASKNDDKVAWYQNQNGSGNFSEQITISDEVPFAFDVVAADFDLDGDEDGGMDEALAEMVSDIEGLQEDLQDI